MEEPVDPVDLFNDDGNGTFEMCLLEEEDTLKKGGSKKTAAALSSCCMLHR